jgi:hypothetical protein
MGFSTTRNNFLYHLYQEVTQYLSAAGIPQWIIKSHVEWWSHPSGISLNGPEVLTTEDLSFGFFIWLMSTGVSIVAFGFELLRNYIKLCMKSVFSDMLGLVLFLKGWNDFRNSCL